LYLLRWNTFFTNEILEGDKGIQLNLEINYYWGHF